MEQLTKEDLRVIDFIIEEYNNNKSLEDIWNTQEKIEMVQAMAQISHKILELLRK